MWTDGGEVGEPSDEAMEARRRWGEERMGMGAACLKSFMLLPSLRGDSVEVDMIQSIMRGSYERKMREKANGG